MPMTWLRDARRHLSRICISVELNRKGHVVVQSDRRGSLNNTRPDPEGDQLRALHLWFSVACQPRNNCNAEAKRSKAELWRKDQGVRDSRSKGDATEKKRQ